MKKKLLLLFSAVVMLTAFTTSCSKECGCTDKDATNYSESAEEDDGTCTYEGNVVFYYEQSTAQALIGDGATSLTFYIDNNIVGSSSCDVYWAGSDSPDCDTEGAVTTTMNLGSSKFETHTYKVVDDTDFERWSGDITFEANTCIAQELTL